MTNTTGATLRAHVQRFTKADSRVYTDEYQSYNHIMREHATVNHADDEWARDDDGDGIREVHCNTVEGMWTDVRNFLRPASSRNINRDWSGSSSIIRMAPIAYLRGS